MPWFRFRRSRPPAGSKQAQVCDALGAWNRMPYPESQYPPGSEEGKVEGEDLALLDGDMAYIAHEFCSEGRLGDTSLTMFPAVMAALALALPHMSGAGREYFAVGFSMLQSIPNDIDERT